MAQLLNRQPVRVFLIRFLAPCTNRRSRRPSEISDNFNNTMKSSTCLVILAALLVILIAAVAPVAAQDEEIPPCWHWYGLA